MDENNEISYKDLAMEKRIEAFIEEQKEVVKLCKKYNNEVGGANGYRVEFNPNTKSYNVYFAQTDILISTQDKDRKFSIRPEGITEYTEFLRKLEEEHKEQMVALRPNWIPTSEQYREYEEKQRQRNSQGESIKDEIGEEDNTKKPEENSKKPEETNVQGNQQAKINSSAIKLPLDKKVDERGKTLGEIFRTKYPELFKGEVEVYVQADEKNVDYFRLYVVGKEKTREIPVKRTTGEHAQNVNALTMPKDGQNINKEQLEQVLELDKDTAIGINFDGKNYTTVYYGSRTSENNWKFQHLVERNKEKEMKDASYEVREATGGSTYENNSGADEEKGHTVLSGLEEQNVPDELNPAEDGISIDEIDDPKNLEHIKADFAQKVADQYGLPPEAAEYVADEVFDYKRNFEDALKETQEQLEEQRTNETKGTIMPGSAVSAAIGILMKKNHPKNEQEQEDKVPEPRELH